MSARSHAERSSTRSSMVGGRGLHRKAFHHPGGAERPPAEDEDGRVRPPVPDAEDGAAELVDGSADKTMAEGYGSLPSTVKTSSLTMR